MSSPDRLGGIIHTYRKYDPAQWPSPTAPPPDVVSPAFEHLLAHGNLREFSEEELARAIRIDPSQIAGLGPSLEALRELLLERRRKILETYETERVAADAARQYQRLAGQLAPPAKLAAPLAKALAEEQLRDLERIWYRAGDDRSPFARQLVQVVAALGDKYQVDELAGKYEFSGRTRLSIPHALEVKEELETIDRLLAQLEEAAQHAQLGVIDLDELRQFVQQADIDQLEGLRRQVSEYLRSLAEQQGLDRDARGFQLTPRAMRLFQSKLLSEIFSGLAAARTGRHSGPLASEGAVEIPRTKPYEFGDSLAQMDIPQSMVNAMLRQGPGLPLRMTPADIEVHITRNSPKCATAVVMDMSGSMRYAGQYINVKRMALALEGLIRREYPGDALEFIEVASLAKRRRPGEIARMMPKLPTLFEPVIRLKADLSDPQLSPLAIPPHFTNLQHGLQMARQLLSVQDTPNRQIVLITDGLPTAHLEPPWLYLLYPPDPRTEEATLREGQLCRREGITINIFMLPNWSQTEEDVRFAYRLAEGTQGRVFFPGGRELDRYVVWDYLHRRRKLVS